MRRSTSSVLHLGFILSAVFAVTVMGVAQQPPAAKPPAPVAAASGRVAFKPARVTVAAIRADRALAWISEVTGGLYLGGSQNSGRDGDGTLMGAAVTAMRDAYSITLPTVNHALGSTSRPQDP